MHSSYFEGHLHSIHRLGIEVGWYGGEEEKPINVFGQIAMTTCLVICDSLNANAAKMSLMHSGMIIHQAVLYQMPAIWIATPYAAELVSTIMGKIQ